MGLMESKAGVKFLFQRFNREPIAVVTVYVGYLFIFIFLVKWLLCSSVMDSGVKVTLTRRPNYGSRCRT